MLIVYVLLMAVILIIPWWYWKGKIRDPNGPYIYERRDFLWPFGFAVYIEDLYVFEAFGVYRVGELSPESERIKDSPYEPWVRAMLLPYERSAPSFYLALMLLLPSFIAIILGELGQSVSQTLVGSIMLLSAPLLFLFLLGQYSLQETGKIELGFNACFLLSAIAFANSYLIWKRQTVSLCSVTHG